MLENIQLTYPTYFLLFCLLAAILYAISLYWRSKHIKEANPRLPVGLGTLRFLSVGLIAFLLLMPFLKHLVESQQEPIILIAEDRSQSLSATINDEALAALSADINQLDAKLSEKYEVKRFSFGEEIRPESIDTFEDQSTNISSMLEYMENQFADQNIGAIVLATDGIFNEGTSPIYSTAKFKAPIHTIALGDTTIKRDLLIKNVLNNRVAYLGDLFNIQIDIQAFNATGSSSKLTIEKIIGDSKTIVQQENFSINSNNFFKTFSFNLDAANVGNVKYRIRLNQISDELSYSNNIKDTYVEILDARQKILLLANAPHPDLAALKTIIEKNKNYEVEVKMAGDPIANLASYDLVTLHNLPSADNKVSVELNTLKSRKIPTLFFVGNQVDLPSFNASQEALKIYGDVSSMNESQAIWDNDFSGYKLDQEVKAALPRFVPVYTPFGEYDAGPKTEVLLTQKIGSVETQFPLVCYNEQNDWKTTIFAGEGFWKWKLFEYQQYQTDRIVTEFINKVIQYSSKKDDKRKFRSFVSKNIFKENEEVIFDAQLYNDNYELINEPEVFLQLTDDKGNKFDYTFSKTNNYYSLNANVLGEGNYNFMASTNYGGQKLNSSGKFAVQSIQKEQYDLTARHGMLNSLSEKFGGQLYYQNEIAQLGTDILSAETIKPIIYQRNKTESLLNLKWLFAAIALFLILEWFLRRFYGTY